MISEGEYLNGNNLISNIYDEKGNLYKDLKKINGLFKEYSKHGKLEFVGEYLNGKKNGKGKEYYTDDKLRFEGEYFNGKEMEKEKNIIIGMVN